MGLDGPMEISTQVFQVSNWDLAKFTFKNGLLILSLLGAFCHSDNIGFLASAVFYTRVAEPEPELEPVGTVFIWGLQHWNRNRIRNTVPVPVPDTRK
jgi:hypothetical protein